MNIAVPVKTWWKNHEGWIAVGSFAVGVFVCGAYFGQWQADAAYGAEIAKLELAHQQTIDAKDALISALGHAVATSSAAASSATIAASNAADKASQASQDIKVAASTVQVAATKAQAATASAKAMREDVKDAVHAAAKRSGQ